MNANCYKIIFSQRLGTLVAVGEHTASTGKAASGQACRSGETPPTLTSATVEGFVGVLRLTFASLALACLSLGSTQAQSAGNGLSTSALPQGSSINTGAATIGVNGAQMAISQTTDKASINWQSFNVGKGASVNITQPSASSVLLNRVVGNDPSQILGKLSANGQLILLNPNGIVFGKDGSVTASTFTASTFGLSDADFMDGFYKYNRNGSTAAVVNQGTIETSAGGFVALIGATVTNEGTIRAPQGDVVLAAAETVTLPNELVKPQAPATPNTVSVRMSKRVRLELDPAAINTAVNNTESGVIVTEGGQVLLQAAALSTAVASVTHSGRIDTSAPQAGAVTVLAEGGVIKVDGDITANSSSDGQGQARKGGDIIIGRDEETGALAKFTDVSGAKLESDKGFVETSGDVLSTSGTRVKAGEWLLDPYNITIASGAATGTDYSNYTSSADSTILAADISANLTAGTSVTLATGVGGASTGNIAVNESISKTGGGDATLTLKAHGNITVAASKTITSNTGKLNVVFNSDSDGANGGGIIFNNGSGITSNGGNITLGGGTALTGTGFAVADGINTLQGISLSSASISAGGGNIAMNGQTAVTNSAGSLSNVDGIYMTGGSITTTGNGTIALTGKNQNTDTQSKGFELASGTITGGSAGAVTITGDSRGVSSSTFTYIRGALINGTVTSAGGNISVTGYGGSGAQYDYGVDIGGSVTAIGSGTVSISGTAGAGGSGGNVGVNTSGAGTISSVDGSITITGTGGIGNGSQIRDHGVQIGGTNAIRSTGSGGITVTGTVTNNDNGFSQGVAINAGGLSTNSGNIKVDATALQNYQVAAYINAPITSTSGNVYIRSASANIQNTTTGTISGNNVSIDNTGGTIDANGVITKGTGGASTWAGVIEQDGIDLNGSVTAANNLNVYGNQTGSAKGIKINGATTTVSGKNVTLYGSSNSGNGVLLSSAILSGQYLNATGATSTGTAGFAWQGGYINTTGTTGTSTASLVKGISAASGNTNGFGAFMMIANSTTNAASGTSITFAGESTTLAAGVNTNERGILIQGGYTLAASGDITFDGSSKSSEGIAFGGIINATTVAGVTNKISIKGTAAASSNNSWNAINFSGAINGNAATSSINFIGDAKNLSGANKDNAVNISGAITGNAANVNIQSTGATIVTSATITGANISIDNTNGTINSGTGVITTGTGTAGSATGISIGGSITATGNLNLSGVSTSGTGINFVTGKGISGANIQAIGKTTNGVYGVLLNGTNTITTTGTSGDSLIEGIGGSGSTNALRAWSGLTLTSANGTTLTLWGDGTSTTDRAARFDGTATTTGAVTLKGTSNNATALMLINGAVTANANSALTMIGTTSSAGQSGVYFVNAGGVVLNDGATLNITGQNTNATGAGVGVALAGAGVTKATSATSSGTVSITGSTSSSSGSTGVNVASSITTDGNITIQGTVTSSSNTGVNIANAVTSYGLGHAININANYNIVHSGSIANTSGGATASMNLTSTLGSVSGSGTLASNGGIVINTASAGMMSGVISGSGSLTKDGAGTTILTATNSYLGATTISAGILQIGDGTTTGTLGAGAVTDNASLVLNRSDSLTLANAISGTGSLTQSGSGTTILTGTNHYAGTTTIGAGTLQVGNGGATGTLGSGAVIDNAALVFNRAGTLTETGAISGSGSLTQQGSGTTILAADNSYSGTTNVSGGTLQIGNGSSTGTLGTASGVTLTNNANLAFNRTANTTIDKIISGDGNVSATITGDLALTSNIALTGTNNTINLTASGSITETAGSLTATNLYLTATGGSIGTAGNRIQSNVSNLSLNTTGNAFVTEADSVLMAATVGNLDMTTTNGTLVVSSVNSINGISATGNITLTGTTSTSNGINIAQSITANSGTVTLTGSTSSSSLNDAGVRATSTVKAKNIIMVASATSTTGTTLGYFGALGAFNASEQLNLTGSSANSGNGFYSYTGSFASGTGMTIRGTSAAGQGVGLDNDITLTNGNSGDISITGTANDASKQAIGLRGSAFTNSGGNTVLNALNGVIYTSIGNPSWNTGTHTNTITNNGSGYVQVTAGNGSATNTGSIDGTVLAITQNSSAGVVVSTSGTGNITTPKITNTGIGDIVVAAGTALAAGDGTGGQVLTVLNNTLTQTHATPGKTYVYTGAPSSTGVLSLLSNPSLGFFDNLYYEGTSKAVNTGFNTAFDSNHANDLAAPAGGTVSGTQVFFRTATQPGFSLTLNDAHKVYGATDPSVPTSFTATRDILTNAVAGVGGSNTFAVTSIDVIAGLTGTRSVGEDVGNYAYTLSGSSAFNTTLTAQPNLVISQRDITLNSLLADNRAYNGMTDAHISGATFNDTVNGETLGLAGAATFNTKDAATGKTVTVADIATLTKSDGAGFTGKWSNYHLISTGVKTTLADITQKSLTISASAADKVYDATTTVSATLGSADIVSGDTVTLAKANASFDNKNAGLGKTVNITGLSISGTDAGNYTLTNTSATTTATISKAPLTVTATAVTKEYDGLTTAPGTPTFTALAGDVVNNAGVQVFANSKDVGTGKTVQASGVTLKDANGDVTFNYNITYVANHTSSITPAPLDIKVNNTSMFVTQDANTALDQGFSFTGFKNGETAANAFSSGPLTRTYTGSQYPSAGSYVGVYGLAARPTIVNDNYTIRSVVNGDLTVVPADKLLITIGNQTDIYGNRTSANAGYVNSGNVSAQYCLVANNCTGANLVNLTMTQTPNNNQWRATDNTGSFVEFDTTAATAAYSTGGFLKVSNYAISATDIVPQSLQGRNFTGSFSANGTLTVQALRLSLSANNISKIYDGNNDITSATVAATNTATGDIVSVTASTGNFASKDVATGIAISLSNLGLSGVDAANYYLTTNALSGTGAITPKNLVARFTAANKMYDGNTTANVVGNSTDIVAGDTVTLAPTSANFDNANVGTAKTVLVTGIRLGGNDAGNYTLQNSTATALADITAASNSGSGSGSSSGTGTSTVSPIKPIVPTDTTNSAESGKGSGNSQSAQNPYLVLPNSTHSADNCTPSNLEACTCEDQDADALTNIAICYQPKKTASTQVTKPRS